MRSDYHLQDFVKEPSVKENSNRVGSNDDEYNDGYDDIDIDDKTCLGAGTR